MIYLLDNDILKVVSLEQAGTLGTQSHLGLISFDELPAAGPVFGISEKIMAECLSTSMSKFESHDGFDFITLNIPEDLDKYNKPQRVCLYSTSKLLLFVHDNNQTLNRIEAEIKADEIKNISLGKIMHLFFDRLTFDDSLVLEKIERSILELDDHLLDSKKDAFSLLVSFRKILLTLKLYFEQLLQIYEAIDENENGLTEQKELRYFRILAGRANRLYNGVLNLRDYVSQVREAYQTQMDINLNSVMKFFTVITSVFFPLTLIVGWYGMNLRMPEFTWRFGYLFVIGISLVVAAATLIYFKRKKWF